MHMIRLDNLNKAFGAGKFLSDKLKNKLESAFLRYEEAHRRNTSIDYRGIECNEQEEKDIKDYCAQNFPNISVVRSGSRIFTVNKND